MATIELAGLIELKVLAISQAAKDVVRLTLGRGDGGPLPAWQPGAHIDLVLTDALVRQYSLCGSPADPRTWEVAVLREAQGRGGSRYVHEQLQVGHALRARGPRNHFELVQAPQYLFIAGGIGITPLLSMIAEVADRGADWRLIYGGRNRASMAFHESLVQRHPDKVQIVPRDECGDIDLGQVLGRPTPETAVYCCGPEGLLAAVEARCGCWPAGALHLERFQPVARPGATTDAAFEIRLARSNRTLKVEAGESIVDVLEKAGVPVFYSCMGGTCGTCETKVLAGKIEHRDCVLTTNERAAMNRMMICVSRADGGALVLDM